MSRRLPFDRARGHLVRVVTLATLLLVPHAVFPGWKLTTNTEAPPLPSECVDGSLTGSFDVSPSGAATYRIPLAVPPGSAGMEPRLALAYNSQSGQGQLGLGWHIEGLSVITRCAANPAQDGFPGSIGFNADDRYCLDGTRLIAINGPDGGNGTEYRTEPDSFAKILSYGSDGYGGPLFFVVYQKSGDILEYGGNAKSDEGRIERVVLKTDPAPPLATLSGVRAWALSKVRDRTGKYMEYDYSESNVITVQPNPNPPPNNFTFVPTGEFWLEEIRYTGNNVPCGESPEASETSEEVAPRLRNAKVLGSKTDGDVCQGPNQTVLHPPYATVRFLYTDDATNSAVPYFAQGGILSPTKRLDKIVTFTDHPQVKVLEYRLRYRPTTFSRRNLLVSVSECGANDSCLPATTLDYFGDNPPPMWLPYDSASTTLDMTAQPQNERSLLMPGGLGGVVVDRETSWTDGIGGQYSQQHDVYGANVRLGGDFNGDGRGDLILIWRDGFLARASILTYPPHDTASSLVEIPNPSNIGLWNEDTSFYLTMDATGDGKTDIVVLRYDSGLARSVADVYESDGEHFARQSTSDIYAGYVGSRLLNLHYLECQSANLNNDGRADLLCISTLHDGVQYPGYEVRAYLSNGNGFDWYDLNPLSNPSQAYGGTLLPGQLHNNLYARRLTMDVNGDGLTDIVFVELGGPTKVNVFLATPKRSASSPYFTWTGTIGTTGSTSCNAIVPAVCSMVFAMDVNGDRNDDLVMLSTPNGLHDDHIQAKVYLSNGAGTGFPSAGFSQQVGCWDSGTRFYPADVNGDGKDDLIVLHPSSPTACLDYNNVSVWISNGKSRGPGVFKQYHQDQYGASGSLGQFDSNAVYMPMDVNGDGKADLVRVEGNHNSWSFDLTTYQMGLDVNFAYLHPITSDYASIQRFLSKGFLYSDLLIHVKDGYGFETAITSYLPLTDGSVYTGPTSLLGHDAFTRDSQNSTYVVAQTSSSDGLGGQYVHDYTYGGAKYHASYGSLGFEVLNDDDPQTGLTETREFYQAHPLTGSKRHVSRRTSTVVTYDEASTWSATATANGSTFIHPDTIDERMFELDGEQVGARHVTYQFDSFGNLRHEGIDYLDGNERLTDILYTQEDPANWILGLPTYTFVQAGGPYSPTVSLATVRNYNRFTRQLTTETVPWLEVGTSGPTIRSLSTAYTYDRYGNVALKTVSGSDVASRTEFTQHDADGRFPTNIYNALDQRTTVSFDHRFGEGTSQTDPNLLTTTWLYDEFGRIARETRPDSTTTDTSYCLPITSGLEGPVNGRYRIHVKASGAPRVTTYYDRLRRELRRATDVFSYSSVVDSEYNSKGQLIRQSVPYFLLSGTAYATLYEYDALGRQIKQTAPTGATTLTSYEGPTAYVPSSLDISPTVARTVHVVNSLGQGTRTLYDGSGQILQVQDYDPTDEMLVHTTYQVDGLDRIVGIADAQDNITRMTYNPPGHRTGVVDPDLGSVTYTTSALGEVLKQEDARSSTSMVYDKLGRLVRRDAFVGTNLEGTTVWTYGTVVPEIGKLVQVSAPGAISYQEDYEYDALGRPSHVYTAIQGTQYDSSYTYYLNNGRLKTFTYPGTAPFAVLNIYDSNGYLVELQNAATGESYWRTEDMDASQRLASQTFGNSLLYVTTYDQAQGTLAHIATFSNFTPLQDLFYSYNTLNNLVERDDSVTGASEIFLYDDLNRLVTTATHPSGSPQYTFQYGYDAIGNILTKSDAGSYAYGVNAGPHAVTSLSGNSGLQAFTYDATGNMLSGLGNTMTWYSFNKPRRITSLSSDLNLAYGPAYEKVRQSETSSGTTTTTTYVGNSYEVEVHNGTTEEHRYLSAGGLPFAVYTTSNNAPPTMRYIHRDHLGSPTIITDESGVVVESLSFDSFGRRRAPNWSAAGSLSSGLNRGFTDHEQLDSVGLVDMKGRVYSPVLGRFLSADPFIANLHEPQGLNGYGYVANNPLSRVDPTGFKECPPDCEDVFGSPSAPIDVSGPASHVYEDGYVFVDPGITREAYEGPSNDWWSYAVRQAEHLAYAADDYMKEVPPLIKELPPVKLVNAGVVLTSDEDLYHNNASSWKAKGSAVIDLATAWMECPKEWAVDQVKDAVKGAAKDAAKAMVRDAFLNPRPVSSETPFPRGQFYPAVPDATATRFH